MSRRIEQVNELLREELSALIARDIEFPPGVLVTITRVETTPDLQRATVFVSILPFSHHHDILQFLYRHRPALQRALNGKMTMHRVPKILFSLDDTEEKATAIESLLDAVAADEQSSP